MSTTAPLSDQKEPVREPDTHVKLPIEDAGMEYPMDLYEPSYNWLCCTSYKDRSKFQNLLVNINLSPVQKQIIKTRYLNILENIQKRARNYGIIFYVGHVVITVGSLFVPALLSIQNSDKSYVYQNSNFAINVYWATFILSLLVTIFNGILTLFKIDKKYYFLNTTLERLRTEGWQYFSLTGRYSGQLLKKRERHGIEPTHRNQFIFFTHYIEKIKMKQVEEEYYKTDERAAQTPSQSTAAPSNTSFHGIQSKPEMFSPSPEGALELMRSAVPDPIQHTVNGMVRYHSTLHPSERLKLDAEHPDELQHTSDEESTSSISRSPSVSSHRAILPSENNPLFHKEEKKEETSTSY